MKLPLGCRPNRPQAAERIRPGDSRRFSIGPPRMENGDERIKTQPIVKNAVSLPTGMLQCQHAAQPQPEPLSRLAALRPPAAAVHNCRTALAHALPR